MWIRRVLAMPLAVIPALVFLTARASDPAGQYGPRGPAALSGSRTRGSSGESIRIGCVLGKTCTDMFVECKEKGGSCNRQIDVGKTLCAFCLDDCRSKRPYKYSECYQCGFE